MITDIRIEDRPVQRVLSVRTRTSVEKLPQILGNAYSAIAQYLLEMGEQPAGPPFAGYFNMDMQDLDIEAGFPVNREMLASDFINPGQIPEAKAVTALYIGPYGDIEGAYDELFRWAANHQVELSGTVYEFYLNDPAEIPPEDLRTQIVFLVKS